MSTQYDSIGERYNAVEFTPHDRLEQHNLYMAIQGYIQGAKALDLGCGTGRFSRELLTWGANSVLGIDISKTMIEAARNNIPLHVKDRLRFEVGDCSIPTTYPGGPFDVVVCAWLFNYAADAMQLARMFETVAQNLKAGGMLFSICHHTTNDLDSWITQMEETQNSKFYAKLYLRYKIPDGIATHVKLVLEGSQIEFDNYCLRRDIYEKCVADTGQLGQIDWRLVDIPHMDGIDDDYWDGYLNTPQFTVLTLKKQS